MRTTLALAILLAVPAGIGLSQDQNADRIRYEKMLESNRRSSLGHYGLAEIYFQRGELQVAANSFREALNGDLDPAWIKVWSLIYLGKIYDLTNQRDRAIHQYGFAQQTKDDTRGAQAEVAKYLQTPYTRGK